MKSLILILSTLCFVNFTYAQTDPEDIIIIYDDEHKDGRLVHKSDLSADLDSLNEYFLMDKRAGLAIKSDSTTLRKRLIGKWSYKGSERANGLPYDLRDAEVMEFKADGSFYEVEENDTLFASWKISTEKPDRIPSVEITFSKPRLMIDDPEIIKQLSPQAIASVTFPGESHYIHQLNENKLVFYLFNLIANDFEEEKNRELHYRLILSTYVKEE